MVLTVAGEKKEYAKGISVKDLIGEEQVESPEYVTVSVNDAFVDQAAFASTVLKENDVVEFIFFMGGGAY